MTAQWHSSAGFRPRVVVIGGGFGGLTVARSLRNAPVDLTLIDRTNYHLFQPLLYQVAMSGLSPGQIAQPIRAILRQQENTQVLMGQVVGVQLAAHRVELADGTQLPYDYLVIAAGATTNYFGNDPWSNYSFGLKTVEDALAIRRRVLLAFEAAERELLPERRQQLLTFVVIGGGPTGVEVAGALSELSRTVLARDFKTIRPDDTRVLLLEMAPRLLPTFSERASEKVTTQLQEVGVEVLVDCKVENIDADGVTMNGDRVQASAIIWAAGVRPVSLASKVGISLEKGRIPVGSDCALAGHPEVFALGDIAVQRDADGQPLPGVAPVAMQQGRHVASMIQADLGGKQRARFRYRDKGMLATVGRSRAIMETARWTFGGFWAWMVWIVVHVWYIIGFRNRLMVLLDWFWAYLSYKRGARLITRDAVSKSAAGKLAEGSLRLPEAHAERSPDGRTRQEDAQPWDF